MNDQGTNGNNCAIPVPSFVYFARVGRMIKIGYSANVSVLSADTFIGNKNSHLLSARFKQRYIDQIDAFDVLRKNVDERAD